MIDFHSHILPGIDDGSESVEESLALLRLEAEQGISHVVATPHFYPQQDRPEWFLQRRRRAEEELRREMARYSGLPRLSVGAEVYFYRGMSESEWLRELTIRDTQYILVEMPPSPWSEDAYRELENIHWRQGLTPVVAHVDRYIGTLRTHGIPERLERMPVLVQANAEFFLERSTARVAVRMLKKDQIQLLGSDCHNLNNRKPNMGPAVRYILEKLEREPLLRIEAYERQIFGEGAV